MRDAERDMLRKTILDLLSRGYENYTLLEKKTIATCAPFITVNTFRRQFYGYLLAKGYVAKVARGKYKITPKGENYLALLS